MRARGARARTARSRVARRPGRSFRVDDSAVAMAFRQALFSSSTHACITWLKPTSLPPTVRLTSVVRRLRAASWLVRTEAVVAPAQATEVNEACACRLAHSCGKARAVRSQLRAAGA